ncbi:MAG: 4-(cytidine 5'-diphospho)-2-C-methyl-D-erythritol kinase [Alphaproteobacteria bacterium]|nr:MAG: 4-(cytidine 5'-diphospho)-2-C-methyl-D-erythritol kinase [Alphaproteobacteria bacterium]
MAGLPDDGAVRITAPAKVNLFLHVTGRRDNGFHLLESLFVFTEKGDQITVRPADALSFELTGPFADRLISLGGGGQGNLVVRAAQALAAAAGRRPDVALTLDKRLPIEAGIGGGSADAAAVLLALNGLWRLGWPLDRLADIALGLGADVPPCLYGRPLHVTGVGEIIRPVVLPFAGALLLAHPGTGSATPAVFRAYKAADTAFDSKLDAPDTAWQDMDSLATRTRNSLESPAISLNPDIADVLEALRALPKARLVRMSGSGSTCFALFDTFEEATQAEAVLRAAHPGWWLMADRVRPA